jgi:hypothetical protein
MLPGAESCASQGTRSEKRKKRLYYSSKKNLDRSRMRNANKEFKFRGPSKLLDFGNADVANIVSVSDGVLQDVQDEDKDEVMITAVNNAACTTEVIVGLTPA